MALCFDLSTRGRILAAGEDRKRLLHAMSTNHVQNLEPGQSVYAFFLNAQGRILADAHILCRQDDLLIDLEPETRRKIFEHLERYIIADDVTLEDVTTETAEVAVEGQDAESALQTLGAPTPQALGSFEPWSDALVLRASATGEPAWRIIAPAAELPSLLARLAAAGVPQGRDEELEALRLFHGVPRYGVDIQESNLIQETRLLHAVHFSKGCYLGQEIVERVRARGQVHRNLVHLRLDLPSPAARGTKILAGDKEVGEITSSALYGGTVYALGIIRVEYLAQPSSLRVAGEPVQILEH